MLQNLLRLLVFPTLLLTVSSIFPQQLKADTDAASVVAQAVDYWRDTSSEIEASMTIHHADWERKLAFHAWTKGEKTSLVKFTAPPKDAGSASLTRADSIWSYTPSISKTIKIPPSMMHQSWMGSDFSHADLARDRRVVSDYLHKLIAEERTPDGKNKVFVVESVPFEDSAVVWGKEIFRISDDHIVRQRQFYDQSMKLVKELNALKVENLGGKLFATVIRMSKADGSGEYTEVVHHSAKFGINIPDSVFEVGQLGSM